MIKLNLGASDLIEHTRKALREKICKKGAQQGLIWINKKVIIVTGVMTT